MSTNKKTRSGTPRQSGFERIERIHPYKTFLFFGLVGSTVLFLSMAFLYLITTSRSITPVEFDFPKIFSVSTMIMLLSSYSLSGAVRAYRDDSFSRLKTAVVGTLLLGLVFCILQAIGWYQMAKAGFFIQSNVGVSYLYIISGIHFVHVIGGMIYLVILATTVYQKSGDVANSLMFLTDEYQLTRIQLITVYWHFVDAIWALLFFMFLFSF
jgi:cytochrome c oxidase subunit III